MKRATGQEARRPVHEPQILTASAIADGSFQDGRHSHRSAQESFDKDMATFNRIMESRKESLERAAKDTKTNQELNCSAFDDDAYLAMINGQGADGPDFETRGRPLEDHQSRSGGQRVSFRPDLEAPTIKNYATNDI